MINIPTLPPKKGYVEVEVDGKRVYLPVGGSDDEPDENQVIINITGSGNSSYSYITMNGTKYISATTLKVEKGTKITAYGYSVYKEGVKLNSSSPGSVTLTVNNSLDIVLASGSSSASYTVSIYNAFSDCNIVTGTTSGGDTSSLSCPRAIGKENIVIVPNMTGSSGNYAGYQVCVGGGFVGGSGFGLALSPVSSGTSMYRYSTSISWNSTTGTATCGSSYDWYSTSYNYFAW